MSFCIPCSVVMTTWSGVQNDNYRCQRLPQHLSALSLHCFLSFLILNTIVMLVIILKYWMLPLFILVYVLVNIIPVNSAHSPPPWENPRAFDFCEKFWSNSPLCCQFRRSNAPPVRASKRVKSLTLQACEANCGNKFCKIFSHYEFLYSACLRSTL